MIKADLFNTEPIVKDEKLYLKLRFSKVARYSPTELLTVDVELSEYLEFLNNVLGHDKDKDKEWKYKSDNIEVVTTKTTAKIICNDHYFTIKLKDIYDLVKSEAEKLYLSGIINI